MLNIVFQKNMAMLNCPVFKSGLYALTFSDNDRMSPYFDVLNIVAQEVGTNITTLPASAYTVYDVFIAQVRF